MESDKGHSEEYFKSYRNYWWNLDFLDLIANRLKLSKCRKILDVGCGQCHWCRLLVSFIGKPAEVHGLDKDPKWCVLSDELEDYFKKHDAIITLKQGDAQDLPYQTDSFDLVTCQTTLIHLSNPQKAIAEMNRVVRPGGLVLCVEPNNLANSLIRTSIDSKTKIEDTISDVRFALLYEQGKLKLGEGDNSYGDYLLEAFCKTNFNDIRVYLSDKASPLFPPYKLSEQQAILGNIDEWQKEGSGPYNKEDIRRFLKAFGERYIGCFDRIYERLLSKTSKRCDAVKTGQYFDSGACIMYLVSGRKNKHPNTSNT